MKLKSVVVTYDDPRVGSFTLDESGDIGGTPSPSEDQAWTFRKGIAAYEWFMKLPYKEKMDFITQHNL
jgi:hypothetical protein